MSPDHHKAPWTEAELELVELNYRQLSHADLAQILGRTEGAIQTICHKRGWLKRPGWTDTELEFVKRNYKNLSHADLGALLGHTEKAIHGMCQARGWLKQCHRAWTDAEIGLVRVHYAKSNLIDLRKLAAQLNRTKASVCAKARQLGLTRQGRQGSEAARAQKSVALRRAWNNPNSAFNSEEYREGQSLTAKKLRNDPNSAYNTEHFRQRVSDITTQRHRDGWSNQGYSQCKGGRRADLGGLYVRSAWEANYARFLDWLIEHGVIVRWEYEPDRFVFDAIKRGARSYLPDFKVWASEKIFEYHEVKGWMDPKSKTRLKRMAKYYPDVRVIVIGRDEYREIENKVGALIDRWEWE